VNGTPVCRKQLEWSDFLNREEIDETGDVLDMLGSRGILTTQAQGETSRFEAVWI